MNNILSVALLALIPLVCIVIGIIYLTRPKSTDDVNKKNNLIGKTCVYIGGSILVVYFLIYILRSKTSDESETIKELQYSPVSTKEWTLESPI